MAGFGVWGFWDGRILGVQGFRVLGFWGVGFRILRSPQSQQEVCQRVNE